MLAVKGFQKKCIKFSVNLYLKKSKMVKGNKSAKFGTK